MFIDEFLIVRSHIVVVVFVTMTGQGRSTPSSFPDSFHRVLLSVVIDCNIPVYPHSLSQ